MRKDKEIAISMRRAGKSYREIKNTLKISSGTLSAWFSGEDWSQHMRRKLTAAAQKVHIARLKILDNIRGAHLARAYEEAREEAVVELQTLKYNPLFIAGLMLYWGEGDKRTRAVRLSNTDPHLIRLFVLFLEEVLRVPKDRIRGGVLIYPDLDDETCRTYWAERSGIDSDRFIKSSRILGRHKTNRLSYGICTVTVSSSYLKVKVLTWLQFLPEELMKKEYYESI